MTSVSLTSDDRDSRLAAVLEELAERERCGRDVDWGALRREHPDLVGELRELWGLARIADGCRASLQTATGETPAGRGAADAGGGRCFGDYELLEELGRGGMGIVFRARQVSLDRIVALKMILRGEHAGPVDVARFRIEAEATARLDHPNITPIYEVGDVAGQPFFTMKHVNGTTLARLLADGPLAPRHAAALLEPICRAIDAAHARGVLHRDLKPSNILIDEAGRPHVTDFGLAKRLTPDASGTGLGALTYSGAILGTPSYMAPEQAAGNRGDVGPASDVYGLGAILYQMLTGRPPFQAASPVDTVLLVLEQDPLPPRLLNPKADLDLELIALKCLQKPPELRYASAAALADDLQAYLQNESISARSTKFTRILNSLLRETHHAGVLENWGLLWMWHSVVLLVLCLITNWFHWRGIDKPGPYLALWTLGMGTWAAIFWRLRRSAGPILFVERQIAHVWAGSVICSTMLFIVEILLHLPVLTLSPVLGLIAGMVFLVKAGILTGAFYVQAAVMFLTSVGMALWPDYGQALFGVMSALTFFVPGWKYYRQRQRARSHESTQFAIGEARV